MIKQYANFSYNNNMIHSIIVAIFFVTMTSIALYAVYTESLFLALSLCLGAVPIAFFAKVSDYKSKYVHG